MCVFIWVVGRDGTPTSALRWGQAGGGRVGVSFPRLRSGDPLQRSKIIRSTHFSRSSSHILLHSALPLLLPPLPSAFPPLLSSSELILKLLFAQLSGLTAGAIISSHCLPNLNLIVSWISADYASRYHLNLIPCRHSSSFYPAAVSEPHISDCTFFGRCVRTNWIWQSHTVHVVVQ